MTAYLKAAYAMTLLLCLFTVPLALASAIAVLLFRMLTNG